MQRRQEYDCAASEKDIRVLFTVVGVPSRFAIWAMPALRALVEIGVGEFDFIHFSTVEQLRSDWEKRRTEHVLLFADCPDINLAKILSRNQSSTIFLWEEPLNVSFHCEVYASQAPIGAARIASLSFATLHDIALECPNLKFISHRKNGYELLRNFAEFFSIPISKEQISEIIVRVGEPPERVYQNDDHLPTSVRASTSPIEKMRLNEDISRCLLPFSSVFKRQKVSAFCWADSLFFGTDKYGSPSNRHIDGPIDLTGPARVLLYGPFFHLPTGEWEITGYFEVYDNQSENALMIEVLSGLNIVAQGTAKLPARGAYSFTIEFQMIDPREAVQLRVSLSQGAIEGAFCLKEVHVNRTGTPG